MFLTLFCRSRPLAARAPDLVGLVQRLQVKSRQLAVFHKWVFVEAAPASPKPSARIGVKLSGLAGVS